MNNILMKENIWCSYRVIKMKSRRRVKLYTL
jgi:hypothetical protein